MKKYHLEDFGLIYIVCKKQVSVIRKWYERKLGTRVKKTSLGETLAEIVRSETLGRRLASAKSLTKSLAENLTRVEPRLSMRLLVRLLARLLALAKRLPTASDRIICMALRKALSETHFFTRSWINLSPKKNNDRNSLKKIRKLSI